MSITKFLEAIQHDLLYAMRAIRKNPLFGATAVLTLALAIGGNTAMFTLNQDLLTPRGEAAARRYCFTNHDRDVKSVFRKFMSSRATFSRPSIDGCVPSGPRSSRFHITSPSVRPFKPSPHRYCPHTVQGARTGPFAGS